MTIDAEIKPCPFCGGSAKAVQTKDRSGWWYGECTSSPCFARQLASQTKDEAIAMWNKREAQ